MNNKYLGMACRPDITVRGLTGTQTPDNSAIRLLDSSEEVVSVAQWTYLAGTLVVHLVKNIVALQNVTFKLNITNKATPQSSPAVFACTSQLIVSATGPCEGMHRDGRSLATVWETPGQTAQPLLILAARFTTKKVGQSVPYPGCLNTITLTIASNVPLFTRCPTRFVITGFKDESTSTGIGVKDAAPITPSATGPTSLTGFQHLEHDNTTWANAKDMWWSPGICNVNDKLGTHFFTDDCEPRNGECTKPGSVGLAIWENGFVDSSSVSSMLNIDSPP